jgi:hypothetical protein
MHECRRAITGRAEIGPSDDFSMREIGFGRPIPVRASVWRGDHTTAEDVPTSIGDIGAGGPR